MLDFFFGDDPLVEMERAYKMELEKLLKIKESGDEEAYSKKAQELEELKTKIDEYRVIHEKGNSSSS